MAQTTIMGALQNANWNLQNNGTFAMSIAKNQIRNAVTLLEKGYPLDTVIDPLLEHYPDVTFVPAYKKPEEAKS